MADIQPTVSLLVAIRNEEANIAKCLTSLHTQDYPAALLEIIVIDGLSEDRSKRIAQETLKNRPNSKVIDNNKKIQSSAWNIGIKESSGEIISIVSGHSEFSPNYVSRAVASLLRTGADMVGGTVRAKSTGLIGEAISTATSTPFGVGNARFRYTNHEEVTDSVFMGFCHRHVYHKIGGYDEELVRNQDDEFSYRLRKAGGKIICDPTIVSTYYNRESLKDLWKQYFQYGFWKVRVLQKHPRQMSLRHFIPTAFITCAGIGLLLSFYSTIVQWLFIGLISLYLLVNLSVSINISAKSSITKFPLLMVIFAILHISYGTGFFIGLFKFSNRWGDKKGQVLRLT